MDIFDILKAISKRKIEIMHNGMSDKDAMTKAELDISSEYHIPLHDIRRLYRREYSL